MASNNNTVGTSTKNDRFVFFRSQRFYFFLGLLFVVFLNFTVIPIAHLKGINYFKEFFGMEFIKIEGSDSTPEIDEEKKLENRLGQMTFKFTSTAISISFLITVCTYMNFVKEWRLFMSFDWSAIWANVPPMLIFLSFFIYILFASRATYFYFVGMFFAGMFVSWDMLLIKSFTTKRKDLLPRITRQFILSDKKDDVVNAECRVLKLKTDAIANEYIKSAKKALIIDGCILAAYVATGLFAVLLRKEIKMSDLFVFLTILILCVQSAIYLIIFPNAINFWNQSNTIKLVKEIH